MNLTDLRSALRERAEDLEVAGRPAGVRVEEVHARVRRVRRRRIAGAGAVTAAALVLVGAVTVLPGRGASPDRTTPAGPPVVHHDNFVSHSGEFDLIAATVGKPGQNTLELEVPGRHGELFVDVACYDPAGRPGDHRVLGWAGATKPERPYGTWCEHDPNTPAEPSVRGAAPGPWYYDPGLTIPAGAESVTVHLELDQRVDVADDVGRYVPASDAQAWLGIAVYTVAEPVAVVADTPIRPLVGLDGQDYAYVESRQSKPGTRDLTWTLEPAADDRYYDVVADDAVDRPNASVSMGLDGEDCRLESGVPRFRAGGCLLSPGRPHTITVSIHGDVPPNAVLGIVLYRKKA